MQSRWCETTYGEFILAQEARLVRQNLSLSAAKTMVLLAPANLQNIFQENDLLALENLKLNKPELVCAEFADGHLRNGALSPNIETGSVDWLVLLHTLESQIDPQALLREATRVLSDGGRLSIYGFNPWRRFTRKFWLWKDKCSNKVVNELGQLRLLDWLRLLNYEVNQVNTLISPSMSRFKFHRKKCLQQNHVTTFPWIGMVYHFEAQRRHFPMTPMRVKTNKEKRKIPLHLVNPSVNTKVSSILDNIQD